MDNYKLTASKTHKKSTITRPTKALKTGIAEIYQKDTCVGDCVQV